MLRNGYHSPIFQTLPALIASLYKSDEVAEEIIDAIECPDGATSRGFDFIDFEPMDFTEAITHIAKTPANASILIIDLATRFVGLEFGQAVAVGLFTNGSGWRVFENDLTREQIDRQIFCEYYIFERPEYLERKEYWIHHEGTGIADSTTHRITLI